MKKYQFNRRFNIKFKFLVTQIIKFFSRRINLKVKDYSVLTSFIGCFSYVRYIKFQLKGGNLGVNLCKQEQKTRSHSYSTLQKYYGETSSF